MHDGQTDVRTKFLLWEYRRLKSVYMTIEELAFHFRFVETQVVNLPPGGMTGGAGGARGAGGAFETPRGHASRRHRRHPSHEAAAEAAH